MDIPIGKTGTNTTLSRIGQRAIEPAAQSLPQLWPGPPSGIRQHLGRNLPGQTRLIGKTRSEHVDKDQRTVLVNHAGSPRPPDFRQEFDDLPAPRNLALRMTRRPAQHPASLIGLQPGLAGEVGDL